MSSARSVRELHRVTDTEFALTAVIAVTIPSRRDEAMTAMTTITVCSPFLPWPTWPRQEYVFPGFRGISERSETAVGIAFPQEVRGRSCHSCATS